MFGHALLTLYRSLTRHRLYAALNILGLAVGIAVFLTLSLYVAFETSFERWIPDASEIYIVRQTWTFPGHGAQSSDNTMGGLLDELKADFPQLVGTQFWQQGGTVRQDTHATSEKVDVVSPDFLRVLDLPLVAGDKRTALRRPDDLLLTETRAKTYFGTLDPMGRKLTLSLQGKLQDYRVAGVLKDPPRSTDLNVDIVVPITPQMIDKSNEPFWFHWGSSELTTYLRFKTPVETEALNQQLDGFTDRRAQHDMETTDAHKFIKLRTIPLLSDHLLDPNDRSVVALLGIVGGLTLLLACMNYVNLATARSALRAREVALRKVMGAGGWALIVQFMAEAMMTAAISALIGLALVELTLPLVNTAGGLALKIDYLGSDSVLPFLVAVVVLVGLGAGVYPAIVLSRFRPAAVLASTRTPGGGRAGSRVREGLVVAQFAVAIAFIIATGVILSQSRYMKTADIGFHRSGLIVVKSFDDSDITDAQRSTLLNLWRTLPGVSGVTSSDIAPGVDDSTNAGNTKRAGMSGDGPVINYVNSSPDFFATYGVRLLAGRTLDRNHGFDDAPPKAPPNLDPKTLPPPLSRNVVLNANAAKTLGFSSPQAALGQPLISGKARPLTVVGVVDNIRFRTPHKPVDSTMYLMSTQDIRNAVAGVRYSGADSKATMARLEAAWRQVAPAVPFHANTAEENLDTYYRPDDQRARLFTIGAFLAVAIGCLGLYGLASFSTARRVKEIGIRKTLGASTADILRLLIGQFLRPVLIANLIAWPLAYLAMQNWLSGFDQRIGLNPLYFIAATFLTLLIAVGTVTGQALAVARSEPAKALRHD
jgi:putative ABC transport system permease protein